MPSLPPLSRIGSRPDGPASPCSPLLRPNFMTKCYPIAADLQTIGRAVHLSNCSCMPLLACIFRHSSLDMHTVRIVRYASFVPHRDGHGSAVSLEVRSMSFLWLLAS